MYNINPKVDQYLAIGCGRCPLVGTPECKVNSWREELETLRGIVLDTPLTEDLKWGVPCYTYEGHNVVLIGAFKGYFMLSFMKGALLSDPAGILSKPGEHSHAGRIVRFTNLQSVLNNAEHLHAYILEAIELEKAGAKVEPKKVTEDDIPEELEAQFEALPAFKSAFYALTPGRQRGYLMHFSSAKQSATRTARIEKFMPKIFEGKGFQE